MGKSSTTEPRKRCSLNPQNITAGVLVVGRNGRQRFVVDIEDGRVIYQVIKSQARAGKAYGVGFTGMCTKVTLCKWGAYILK